MNIAENEYIIRNQQQDAIILINDENGFNKIKGIRVYEVENQSNPLDLNVNLDELFGGESEKHIFSEEMLSQVLSIDDADKLAAELSDKIRMNLMECYCLEDTITYKGSHFGGTKYTCPKCNKMLGSGVNLLIHYHLYSNKPTLECFICKDIYEDYASLAQHTLQLHGARKLYKCDQCDKVFNMFPTFKQHFKTHLGIKEFACSECSYVSNRKTNLSQHMRSHSSQTKRCPICMKELRPTTSMKKHLLAHGVLEDQFSKLINTQNQNNSSGGGICPICEKVLKKNVSLKKHINQHYSIKPECIVCKTSFANPNNFQIHKTAKHGKVMQCYMCIFFTEDFDILQAHFDSHSENEKALPHTYKCYACDLATTDLEEMKSHNDSGHKTIFCGLCDKGFTDEHHLSSHMRFKHVQTDFQCSKCKCYFRGRKSLVGHVSTCTGVEERIMEMNDV